jgi:phage baseplate assembly protein W
MAYYEDYITAGYKKKFVLLSGLSSGDYDYGHTSYVEGVDKIKQNIITLFSIDQGEVFFNPSIGASLQKFLFEPNDFILKDTLDRHVRQQIKENIKEVQVKNVDVVCEDIYVTICIQYMILATGYFDKVEIVRKRSVSLYD